MSNQVISPRRSSRLATIIPASYWMSIGYSNEEASAMENLQNDIKAICYGDSDKTEISLRGSEPGTVIPHHDMMIPHWQKLFRALNGLTSTLHITDISLPIPVLDIMFPIQSIDLKTLTFYDVKLGNDGLLKLSSFLRENTSVKKLCIGGDLIDDISVASSLSDAIKNHPTLEILVLVRCFCAEHDTGILEKIMEGCCGLRELRLGYEKLGVDGITIMADFIRSNNPTQIIQLEDCELKDIDTLLLTAALKKNTYLKELDLVGNDITESGDKNLLKAMYDPTSIDSIIESNHTIVPYTYDDSNVTVISQRPLLEQELFTINADDNISVQKKIRQKVILAFCGVDGGLFDLSHLNDFPLQLMPRVLELIQKHTAIRRVKTKTTPVQLEKDAMTRLFHTLRGWELPLLFENLNPKKGAAGKRKRRKTRR